MLKNSIARRENNEPAPSPPESEKLVALGGSTTLCSAFGIQTTQPTSLSAFGYYEYSFSNTLGLFSKVSLPVEACTLYSIRSPTNQVIMYDIVAKHRL